MFEKVVNVESFVIPTNFQLLQIIFAVHCNIFEIISKGYLDECWFDFCSRSIKTF